MTRWFIHSKLGQFFPSKGSAQGIEFLAIAEVSWRFHAGLARYRELTAVCLKIKRNVTMNHIPVRTQRHFNVHTTSLQRYKRYKDVETTLCAYRVLVSSNNYLLGIHGRYQRTYPKCWEGFDRVRGRSNYPHGMCTPFDPNRCSTEASCEWVNLDVKTKRGQKINVWAFKTSFEIDGFELDMQHVWTNR